jgi:hypothetical protein
MASGPTVLTIDVEAEDANAAWACASNARLPEAHRSRREFTIWTLRGLWHVGWAFTFAAAAYNLVRMRTLLAAASARRISTGSSVSGRTRISVPSTKTSMVTSNFAEAGGTNRYLSA